MTPIDQRCLSIARTLGVLFKRSDVALTSRGRLRAILEGAQLPAGISGAFLFGSLARAEPARDLDLFFVVDGNSRDHQYERVTVEEIECDVNVVTRAWLQEAWRDPEWGYWLTEAYPLAVDNAALVNEWQQSANRYWSAAARADRNATFVRMFARFSTTARRHAAKSPLYSRYLAHEAIRIALIALIDRFGARPFSHSTFVAEAFGAARHASVSVEEVLAGLVQTPGDYVPLRAWVSELLRSELVASMGFARGDALSLRVDQMCSLDESRIETELASRRADQLLVSKAVTEVGLVHAELVLASSAAPSVRRKRLGVVTEMPALNPVAGIRWQHFDGKRLKLVIGTGGCRTPSCVFCSLPAYGRREGRADIVDVSSKIEDLRPTAVALYNDGSLLNPQELAPPDLDALCDSMQVAGVRHLEIESIPRFVFADQLREIQQRAGLASLTVAMGLQAAGNAFSMVELGRPDVDAIFERAIAEAQEAGVRVRTYLLWGFGPWSRSSWEERLGTSIRWALARNVNRVTICPFVTGNLEASALSDSLCGLREALFHVRAPVDGRVDVSLPDHPSCGVTYAGRRCAQCESALVEKAWQFAASCLHSQERRHGTY